MSSKEDIAADLIDIPDDVKWLRASFLMSDDGFDDVIKRARNYSVADDKYQNTTLGGNYAVNVPPQFTHTADPNIVGFGSSLNPEKQTVILPRYADNVGMGRFYSEAIDDNKDVIHMRFGVAEFNTLASFFLNSYDGDLARLAKKGEASKGFISFLGSTVGTLAGFVVSAPCAAFTVLFKIGSFAYKLLFKGSGNLPHSNYYYIKPTMRLYWKAVNQMVNTLAVNLGILPSYLWDGSTEELENNRFTFFNKDDDKSKANLTPRIVEEMHRALPDIFRKEGGIDVRAVSNKVKRLELRRREKVMEILDDFEKTEDIVDMNEELEKLLLDRESNALSNTDEDAEDWFVEYLESRLGDVKETDEEEVQSEEEEAIEILSSSKSTVGSWLFDNDDGGEPSNTFSEYLEAEYYSGSDWVTFRVAGEKTVSESFSNEVGESAISEKVNSTAGAARDAKFNFAGGSIGIPGLQTVIDFVTSASDAFVSTLSKYTGMDGLGILLGGGFIDIPHTWKNSTANLPKMEYKIELRATYGNKISIFIDEYVQLMMLLATVLPLSTGRNSYTSPFLVEVYKKGRSQIRMGIVESVSVTRGVGNTAWSVDQLPLGIDVSISIADLSKIVHMPIDSRLGAYDDNTAYGNYMATLGSLGLMDITNWFSVEQRAKAKFNYDWGNTLFNSKSHMASLLGNAGVNILGTNITIKNMINTFGDREKIGRHD